MAEMAISYWFLGSLMSLVDYFLVKSLHFYWSNSFIAGPVVALLLMIGPDGFLGGRPRPRQTTGKVVLLSIVGLTGALMFVNWAVDRLFDVWVTALLTDPLKDAFAFDAARQYVR